MSTAIYGEIVTEDLAALLEAPDPGFSWVSYCAQAGFGISFVPSRDDLCFFGTPGCRTVRFYLQDSFLNTNCEEFLCPILYTPSGGSSEPQLVADLEKLVGLLRLMFRNRSVSRIDLYFSDGTATLPDFRRAEVPLEGLAAWLLAQYRRENWLPTVQVSVPRSDGA